MERVERDKFCVINVKYKEISWRVRRKEKKKKKKKSNFQKHRVKLVLKKREKDFMSVDYTEDYKTLLTKFISISGNWKMTTNDNDIQK